MAITIKALAEALADLFGVDETEVLVRLTEKGIINYGEFRRYLEEVGRQDRVWKSRGY